MSINIWGLRSVGDKKDLFNYINGKIINLKDLENDKIRLTKCHVGFIPYHPKSYGFNFTFVSEIGGNNFINIFNDDLNSVWEVSPLPFFYFNIECPTKVAVWKIVFIFPNNNVILNYNVNIYAFDDNGNSRLINNDIFLQLIYDGQITSSGVENNDYKGYLNIENIK